MKLEEQERVLQNNKKNMLVSASAGSGKTYIMIKYICQLICENKIPLKNFLVLTFTKAAATQMKERLLQRLKEQPADEFIIEQIDSLPTANISTIHSFCEKCLKKHANLLDLNENFSIIDESISKRYRSEAFEKALKNFAKCNEEGYAALMEAFKNDKKKIKEIVFEIQMLSSAVANKDEFLKQNLENSEILFDDSAKFLAASYKNAVLQSLDEIEKLHVDDFELQLREKLSAFLESVNLFEMAAAAENFSFPYLPKRKIVGDEVVDKLQSIKGGIVDKLSKLKELNLSDEQNVEMQRMGKLEKSLLKLFEIYEQEENKIKKSQNCLDFSDLEKWMSLLSQKENLFDGLQFVFVDEYQDTNKIQEKIIKNVAKNCNFVAVGDVKQGIYGFRLASAEIFLKDLKEFSEDENSNVNYLQSNFRSDKNVLEFVNDIFKVCMTEETGGVNYEKTSMLKGVGEFVSDGEKSVTVDILTEDEESDDEIPEVYSVKNAKLKTNNKNKRMLLDIKRRILEVMQSKISDGGELRSCKFSDIAILSRKRDFLFNEIEICLQESGIPVISNSRNNLLDEPQVKVLLNYLKLALAFDDDIACLSVLLSGLYGFSIEKIEKIEKNDEKLCENIRKNQNFSQFIQDLQDFKFDYVVFGLKKSFENLFMKTGYRAFLNGKKDAIKVNAFVDKFLTEVSKFDFDLPKAIQYIENVEIPVSAEVSVVEDAVLLTTIHNSKGLEYPIVFVVGCDKSLSKARPKSDLEINENFGLALKMYDSESNREIVGVKMRAIQEQQSEKDFVEELMIFYVALTRAKNRLYLFGQDKNSIYERYGIRQCDSYFDFIFFALKNVKKQFLEDGNFEDEILSFNLIEEVGEIQIGEKQNLEEGEFVPQSLEKIEKYLDFEYKFDENLNFRLKESVTSLGNKNQEEKLVKFNNDSFNFASDMVDIGNAYHFALKAIDFEKVSSLETLKREVEKNKEFFDANLVDERTLLSNLLILKDVCDTGKVVKEKEFLLRDKLCNLLGGDVEDEILVQGVVDLFVVKEDEIVLVDYKYSNSNSEEYLIEKYKNQLKLYKIALENSFKLPVKDIYLLSLRNNKLINVKIL
ncbi:MAG: UvrD-helicase domain-containing protein [Clostridia bacterium]|nr:UvrD-helicase domain-containing protein [Clostridia bacterium]